MKGINDNDKIDIIFSENEAPFIFVIYQRNEKEWYLRVLTANQLLLLPFSNSHHDLSKIDYKRRIQNNAT
jgi:hypothetical protein